MTFSQGKIRYSVEKLKTAFRKFYGRHSDLVGKYNISVSHMLQGLFDNNIWSWFEVILWRVPHVGQEMLTLSGTPDLTPAGVHIHFLPWVRSANFVCPWTILYGCWFWFVCLAESGFVVLTYCYLLWYDNNNNISDEHYYIDINRCNPKPVQRTFDSEMNIINDISPYILYILP